VHILARNIIEQQAAVVIVFHPHAVAIKEIADDFVPKFPKIAGDYYAGRSRDIDIIKLNGSIEIAPLLGLSDVIVDIVETGKTLLENGLEPKEEIVPISARLIANKVAYKFKNAEIRELCRKVSEYKK